MKNILTLKNSSTLVDLLMEKPGIDLLQLVFFIKQPVYKQLALEWQIEKQLSGLNPLSLSNNKNYCQTDNTPKFSCLKNIFGNILKSVIINVDFEF